MTYEEKFRYSMCKMCVFGKDRFCRYLDCKNCPNKHDIYNTCRCEEELKEGEIECPSFIYLGGERL